MLKFLLLAVITALLLVQTRAQVDEEECPGCTYTIGYWKNHPEAWPPGNFSLCGYSYMTILKDCNFLPGLSPQWCNVARQYVGLTLNLQKDGCSGADLDFNADLQAAYANAPSLLCTNSKSTFKDIYHYSDLFTLYNEGHFFQGPVHCPDDERPPPSNNGTNTTIPDPECRLVCKCDLVFQNDSNPECNPDCLGFCTLTQGYWKTQVHWDDWPAGNWTICGDTFLNWWSLTPGGNVWIRLIHQYMAATLNVAFDPSGDCTPDHIEEALAAAQFQLTWNCSARLVQDVQIANDLHALLDSFNNGNQSVEHCPGGPGSGNQTTCDNGNNNNGTEPVCDNCTPILDCCPVIPPPTGGNLGCTLTIGFWKNHRDLWPLPEETELCDGLTYGDIMDINSDQSNYWYKLAHQYIAALLNAATGAYVPESVQDVLNEALALLLAECHEILPSETEAHALASHLNDILSEYNEGKLGVPHCGSHQFQNETCPALCPPGPPPHVCLGGCTYTQGYWKNHYSLWPIDYTGAILCNQTWLDLYNTAPKNGDAFLILAHQYMTAEMNVVIMGACTPEAIADALEEAHDMLYSCDPSLFSKTNAASRNRAIYLAALLDQFNNGLIGPGHCDVVDELDRRRALVPQDPEQLLNNLIAYENVETGVAAATTVVHEVSYVADPATATCVNSLTSQVSGLSNSLSSQVSSLSSSLSTQVTGLSVKLNSLASSSSSVSSAISRVEQALAALNQPLGEHSAETHESLVAIAEAVEFLKQELDSEGHYQNSHNKIKSLLKKDINFDITGMTFAIVAAVLISGGILLFLIYWWFFSGSTRPKRP